MKSLLLVQKEQKIILDSFYEALKESLRDCDVLHLDSKEQNNLRAFFKSNIDVCRYDRIILFLRFKKEIRQYKFIQTIPNLVILEHDACQNYIAGWKYEGKYSQHYSRLPWARILVSGNQIAQKLRDEGYDCNYVQKGYDPKRLSNLGMERDIDLGFVGSTRNKVYSSRKSFLEEIQENFDLKILKTKTSTEYNKTLNRIKLFLSADVGLGEYMAKNFEALACGCTLVAFDQGELENKALGFIDMENVVLYDSIKTLREKIDILKHNKELQAFITKKGQELAERSFQWSEAAMKAAEFIRQPLRKPLLEKKWLGLSRVPSWE